MAIAPSTSERVQARRQVMIDRALDHAIEIATRDGVGAVTTSEVARRMGIRQPSLYKYFGSLHAVYDALFARGNREYNSALRAATRSTEPGLPTVHALAAGTVRWSMENRALAQLMFTRPIPHFVPSPEAFAPAIEALDGLRTHVVRAVELGQLAPTTDTDELVDLVTSVIAGISSQQLANDPEAPFESGRFSSLTGPALDIILNSHRSRT